MLLAQGPCVRQVLKIYPSVAFQCLIFESRTVELILSRGHMTVFANHLTATVAATLQPFLNTALKKIRCLLFQGGHSNFSAHVFSLVYCYYATQK